MSSQVLARATGPGGESVLRRRDGVLELVLDGVFAMDSAHTTTEEALADLALERLEGPRALRVLVAGLGLGFTAARVLADTRVAELVVVELEPALVAWAAQGLLPVAGTVLADCRTRVVVGDVLDVVPAVEQAAFDAVVLDVDNGPGFLVHQANAALYGPAFLHACAGALARGGVLAVWSSQPSPALVRALARTVGDSEQVLLPVERDGRCLTYAVVLARRERHQT